MSRISWVETCDNFDLESDLLEYFEYIFLSSCSYFEEEQNQGMSYGSTPPPYNKNVSTNVGRKFLHLIQKHFNSGHLKQLFNKNNMKVSYSFTQNIASIIKSHNTTISTTLATETDPCNCRKNGNSTWWKFSNTFRRSQVWGHCTRSTNQGVYWSHQETIQSKV